MSGKRSQYHTFPDIPPVAYRNPSVSHLNNEDDKLYHPLPESPSTVKKPTIMKEPTLDEINTMFQDYQDDLVVREKNLKFPVRFTDYSLDDILDMLDMPEPKKLHQKIH